MVKNIVFDLGGVLIDFNPHATLRSVFCEADAVQVEQALFGTPLWRSLDLGERTFADLARDVCKLLPERLHADITGLLLDWWNRMPPFPFMVPLVQALREHGCRLYLCSNTPADIYDHIDDIPALSYFDGILASCDYGVAKPDSAIFEALYDKFSLDPAECFFIDDMPQNIEGAAKTGMQGYCFAEKDVNKLKDALRKVGVNI